MTEKKSPIRPTDDEARALAKSLIAEARHGALGVMANGEPMVSRIAVAKTDHGLLTLISDLSHHTVALRENPNASLLLGEPGKGDPVAHPRITLQVTAEFLEKTQDRADAYLALQPKASLYIGFADFNIAALNVRAAFLNGGFGKAYTLTPDDLA